MKPASLRKSSESIQVKVKYFAALREIIGRDDDTFHLRWDASVEDAVKIICKIYGEELSRYLLDERGTLQRNFQVIVDGSIVEHSKLAEWMLKEDDIFIILPPVGGG